MRIAYVTHARLPSRAANAVQTIKMAAALGEAGHEVTLYSRPGDVDADVASAFGVGTSFTHAALPATGPRGARTAAWLWRLRTALREQRPTLVYSRDLYALCAVADLDVRLCFEAHWSPRDKPALRAALLALSARAAFVRIVAISAALRDELLTLLPGFPPEQIVVVPSAADDIVIAAGSASSSRLRVGYAGQLYAGKGAELLAPIARARPNVDVHVVGGEPADVAKWAAAAPANLFFHGHRPHAQVAAFLADVDVVLAPYQAAVVVSGGAEVARWMSPLKVFEYMAMSRAIVASDLPALRECLSDGHTALLVPPDDVDAWCRAIDALHDEALRTRLGTAARARFLAAHTWPQRAARILAGLPERGSRRAAVQRTLRSAVALTTARR